ncbi:hypothetical protein GOP47_0014735 [Adiantum capillus-veneris]|uniref:HMA domain-containing protein n=1 Tax=Adiantum capillus-veneris TaxID=13818 RepID=A0A9D4UMW7_ADICA|nr:hypothetical protein GOP47_0014735 [Adiantum capillus-veneris]
MPEEEKKDKKEEAKKDEGKIILEARMHCESCRYKVYKAIIGYPGVEDINIDMKSQKVTLKAPKVDAKKLFDTVKKKSGGKVVKLLHPDPNAEKKKEDKKDEKKKEEKKPADVTVVLKVQMHCGACTKKVEKAAWKIGAVYNVKVEGEKVTIKGTDLDPKKVCEEVIRRSGKHAEVVPPKKDEKKDGDKKDGGGKKEGGEKKDGDKKEGGGENKKDGDKKDDVKKEEKQAPKYVVEYVYAPQYFSDENPNACAIM